MESCEALQYLFQKLAGMVTSSLEVIGNASWSFVLPLIRHATDNSFQFFGTKRRQTRRKYAKIYPLLPKWKIEDVLSQGPAIAHLPRCLVRTHKIQKGKCCLVIDDENVVATDQHVRIIVASIVVGNKCIESEDVRCR